MIRVRSPMDQMDQQEAALNSRRFPNLFAILA